MADSLTPDPALGLIELDSIAIGVLTGDAMVKAAPIDAVHAGTVHPGRYLVLVSGDTASVEIALAVGRVTAGPAVIDAVFLADIHPDVTAAIVSDEETARPTGEAVAVIETATVACAIDAADAAVKTSAVDVSALRLADGLGGKAYLVLGGELAEVEAAVERALERVGEHRSEVRSVVVAQLSDEMRHNLASDLRFGARVGASPQGDR